MVQVLLQQVTVIQLFKKLPVVMELHNLLPITKRHS